MYVDVSFYITIKLFKNITLHIKLKTLSYRMGLQTTCILFITHATNYSFYYKQIKWEVDILFEFLKAENQFLETDL
jgi:hypothetical protein